MEKPELVTKNEVFFDYYLMQLINEQKKTNKLLQQLLGQEEPQDVAINVSETRRKRKLANV